MEKIKFILTTIFLILFFCSCEDYLEKYPLDQPSDKTYLSNETEMEMAINAAHQYMWFRYIANNSSSGYRFLDYASDIGMYRPGWGSLNVYPEGVATSESSIFSRTWGDFYRGIAQCNYILDNMERGKDNVSEEFYDRIRGQALFLRSFYYFYLTELYGDVPLVITGLNMEEALMPRTPKSQVVDQILADLDLAYNLLPIEWPAKDVGRETKGAVLTLKARTALFNGRYSIAAQAAQAVMDMSKYSLYPDYDKLFLYEGMRNQEVILDLPYQLGVKTSRHMMFSGPRNVGCWCLTYPTLDLIDSYECTDGQTIDKSSLYDPSHPFNNRDPRLDMTVIREGTMYGGYVWNHHPDSIMTSYYDAAGNHSLVTNYEVTKGIYASRTGYNTRKAFDEADISQKNESELNFILMRYAEVLLMYAEAKIELNDIDGTVYDAINQVRQRPGVNMPVITPGKTQAELRDILRRERKIELAFEGFRMFDIHRWKIAEYVMNISVLGKRLTDEWWTPLTPTFDEYGHHHYIDEDQYFNIATTRTFSTNDYLWAIPQKEIDINNKLVQNPGY